MYCQNQKNLDTLKNAEIILKFEQYGFTVKKCIQKMQTEWPRPVCPKTKDYL